MGAEDRREDFLDEDIEWMGCDDSDVYGESKKASANVEGDFTEVKFLASKKSAAKSEPPKPTEVKIAAEKEPVKAEPIKSESTEVTVENKAEENGEKATIEK